MLELQAGATISSRKPLVFDVIQHPTEIQSSGQALFPDLSLLCGFICFQFQGNPLHWQLLLSFGFNSLPTLAHRCQLQAFLLWFRTRKDITGAGGDCTISLPSPKAEFRVTLQVPACMETLFFFFKDRVLLLFLSLFWFDFGFEIEFQCVTLAHQELACCISQTSLKLRDPPASAPESWDSRSYPSASASWMLWWQAWAITLSFMSRFLPTSHSDLTWNWSSSPETGPPWPSFAAFLSQNNHLAAVLTAWTLAILNSLKLNALRGVVGISW